MTYVSFCSGIEAVSCAWEPLGYTPLAFSEIDRFPSRLLALEYPRVPNLGDFTKVDWRDYMGADICVGGTPCQAFSVAGLRNSLDDARGNLSLEFIRAVNTIGPRFVVWENVPGVLSTRDNAFGCFLAGLVGSAEPLVANRRWPDSGVVHGPQRNAAWRILDAQYFGLAQRRKRVFVIAGFRDGPHPAEILLEWESLRRDSPPRRQAGEGTSRGIEIGPSGGGFCDVNPTLDARCKDGPIRNQLAGAVAMCLNAKGGGDRIDAESETFVAQSYSLDLRNFGTSGTTGFWDADGVTPALDTRSDANIGVAHALRGEGGLGRIDAESETFVAEAWSLDLKNTGGGGNIGVRNANDATHTLDRQVNIGVAHALRGEGFDASEEGTGRGTPLVPMFDDNEPGLHKCDCGGQSVRRMDQPCPHCGEFRMGTVTYPAALTVNFRGRDGGTQAELGDEVATALRCAGGTASKSHALTGMAVRRLTPVECEILMGFPPGYTDIPGAADGNRYKALGNSMAVPVMAWIGRRILAACAGEDPLLQ